MKRSIFEKQLHPHLVNNFSSFITRSFITAFTTARRVSLTNISLSAPRHPIMFNSHLNVYEEAKIKVLNCQTDTANVSYSSSSSSPLFL